MATADLARAGVLDAPRIVTREATAAEDHDSISEEAFRRTTAAGDFALWWEAHRLGYGIPSTVNDNIRAGRRVVCNGVANRESGSRGHATSAWRSCS